MRDSELPILRSLDELADVVRDLGSENLYVRWSLGPETDRRSPGSRDALTGVELPGLSANPLRVEPWWDDRSMRLWLARRLYDYRHLRELRGPGVRAWILEGTEEGRGPDNEPLVSCHRPLAWIADSALRECEQVVAEQNSDEWGPLDRRA